MRKVLKVPEDSILASSNLSSSTSYTAVAYASAREMFRNDVARVLGRFVGVYWFWFRAKEEAL